MRALIVAIQTGIPVLIWGPPGTGKTSFIYAFAQVVGRWMETVIASIREPSDFAGLPIIASDDSVKLAAPQWVKNIVAKMNAELESIVFLDELSTAPPAVQAALLRPVFEGVVGDVELPKNTWWIAAANPTESSAGTWDLNAAQANRWCHYDWNIEPIAWVEGMQNNFQITDEFMTILPDNWRESIPQYRSLISSFIKARPALLLVQPDNTEEAGKAWASPRTWDYSATMLAAARSVGLSKDEELILITGLVGTGPASEFFTWEKSLNLPDPHDLLDNPESFDVPSKGDVTFAILSSVVTAATADLTKKNWNAAWAILGAAAKAQKADIAAIPAKNLAKARKDSDKLEVPKDVKAFVPVLKKAGLLG
jgi:predicted AAA+ superfamily ATPase